MATFGAIQTRVLNNLIDAKASVQAAVADLLNSAILEACEDRNWQCMRATQPVNTTAGSHTLVTMPATFKELNPDEEPYWTTQAGDVNRLAIRPTLVDAYKTFSPTDATDKGSPSALVFVPASDGQGTSSQGLTAVQVFPFPDGLSDWTTSPAGEYRITIPYWANMTPLVNAGDTNWFTIKGELWLEHYATGLGFMRDWAEQRATSWFTLAAGYYKKLKRFDGNQVLAGVDTLVPRSDVNARTNQLRR